MDGYHYSKFAGYGIGYSDHAVHSHYDAEQPGDCIRSADDAVDHYNNAVHYAVGCAIDYAMERADRDQHGCCAASYWRRFAIDPMDGLDYSKFADHRECYSDFCI